MITKNEWKKSIAMALFLLVFCYSLPDIVRWAKSWEIFTWIGVIELLITAIFLVALAIFVVARYDKVNNEIENRKQKLKYDLREQGKWK